MSKTEEAEPAEWFLWFWENADFGPAHGDVMDFYEEAFFRETGKKVPKEYSIHDEEY